MPAIMSLFVFQSSRLQLLASLKHRFSVAAAHRDEHVKRGEPEDEHERKAIDNLLRAVEAADEQCKRLEFWSDYRSVAQHDGVLGRADHSHGLDHEWKETVQQGSSSDESSSSLVESKNKGKERTKEDIKTGDMVASGDWANGANGKETKNSTSKEEKAAHEDEAAVPIKEEDHGKKEDTKSDTPNVIEESKGEEDQDDVD
jgi:hypothetical protein